MSLSRKDAPSHKSYRDDDRQRHSHSRGYPMLAPPPAPLTQKDDWDVDLIAQKEDHPMFGPIHLWCFRLVPRHDLHNRETRILSLTPRDGLHSYRGARCLPPGVIDSQIISYRSCFTVLSDDARVHWEQAALKTTIPFGMSSLAWCNAVMDRAIARGVLTPGEKEVCLNGLLEYKSWGEGTHSK